MPQCVVTGCQNYELARCIGIPFHRFPSNTEIRRQWLVKIRTHDHDASQVNASTESLKSSIRVCGKHFVPSDYERDLVHELTGSKRRNILKKDAIPSIFPVDTEPASFEPDRAAFQKQEKMLQQQHAAEFPPSLYPIPTEIQNPEKRSKPRSLWKSLVNRVKPAASSGLPWSPNSDSPLCSDNFVDGEPTPLNPHPTLHLGYDVESQAEILLFEDTGDITCSANSAERHKITGRGKDMSKMPCPNVIIKPNGVENKQFKDILFDKMQDLWISKKMVDITIRVDDSEVQAHQFVLAASSELLCDNLLQMKSTTRTRNVVMDLSQGGFKMAAVKELLNYIYLGKMKFNYTTCNEVRKAANMLQIYQVVAVCDIFEGSFICKKEIVCPVAVRHEAPPTLLKNLELGKQNHGQMVRIGIQKKGYKDLLKKSNKDILNRSTLQLFKELLKKGEKNEQNDEQNNQTDNKTPDTVTSSEEMSSRTVPGHRQNLVSILGKRVPKTPDSAPRKMKKLSHNRAGSLVTGPISAHCNSDGPHGICNETYMTYEDLSVTDSESYNLPEARSSSHLRFDSSKSSKACHRIVSKMTVEIEGIEHTFEIENMGGENEDKNVANSQTDSAQETKCVPRESFSDVKVKIEPP